MFLTRDYCIFFFGSFIFDVRNLFLITLPTYLDRRKPTVNKTLLVRHTIFSGTNSTCKPVPNPPGMVNEATMELH